MPKLMAIRGALVLVCAVALSCVPGAMARPNIPQAPATLAAWRVGNAHVTARADGWVELAVEFTTREHLAGFPFREPRATILFEPPRFRPHRQIFSPDEVLGPLGDDLIARTPSTTPPPSIGARPEGKLEFEQGAGDPPLVKAFFTSSCSGFTCPAERVGLPEDVMTEDYHVARRLSLSNDAIAVFVVNATGTVEPRSIAVFESGMRDDARRIAAEIRRLRFLPAQIGTRAVRQRVRYHIRATPASPMASDPIRKEFCLASGGTSVRIRILHPTEGVQLSTLEQTAQQVARTVQEYRGRIRERCRKAQLCCAPARARHEPFMDHAACGDRIGPHPVRSILVGQQVPASCCAGSSAGS